MASLSEVETATASKKVTDLIQQWREDSLGRDIVVVVAGKSGTGKSTLINNFLALDGSRAAACHLQPTSVTKTVRRYDGSVNGVPVRAIDMPGLHARKHKKDEELDIIVALSQLTEGNADILIYCVSLTQRLDTIDEKNIDTLNKAFGEEIWKSAIFVLTHADSVLEDQENESNYDEIVEKFTKEIQDILVDSSVNVCVTSVSSHNSAATVDSEISTATPGLGPDNIKIVGIPIGKKPNKPRGWRVSLLSQIICLCHDKAVANILKLKHVSWERIAGIIHQAAMAGAEAGAVGGATGAGVGSGIGAAIGAIVLGATAASRRTGEVGAAVTGGATLGAEIGSVVGGCSLGVLSALAEGINNIRNQNLALEIALYFKVSKKLKELKDRLPK